MDPDIKRLLEENHALAKDNHRLLRAVRRHQLIGMFWKVIVWFVIFASVYYYYQFYLKPMAAQFQTAAAGMKSGEAFNLPSSADVQKLIDSYKVKQ